MDAALQQNILIGAFGAIGTAIIGLFFWFVRRYFEKGESETKENKSDTRRLAEELATLKAVDAKMGEALKLLCRRTEEMVTTMNILRSEIDNNMRQLIKDQGRIEGRFDESMGMMANYTQSIGHMSRQIDALFRFVDAPHRKTDKDGTNG
jgi:hypothetical protein